MSKYEVMASLRKEFDEEILPYYNKAVLHQLVKTLAPRCKREKKTITLPWIDKKSKSYSLFRIQVRGAIEGVSSLFVCEFRWKNKVCYGNFFPEGNVVVYQSHSLERYAQRVLQRDVTIQDVFYKHIVKNQEAAYHIVLPTPTHPFSYYHGTANALFLGDYDSEHLDDNFLWCNTCISYNETRYSQLRITQSLHSIQEFVLKAKHDLSEPKNEKHLQQYNLKYGKDDQKMQELMTFLVQKYLLWKLHLSYKFEITEHFRSEVDENLRYIEHQLRLFNVYPQSLSPFSKNHGIAWKGEIDYRGQ
jgi:hypothetical protein